MRYLRALFIGISAVLLAPALALAQNSCPIFTSDLTYGDTGSAVTQLQVFLQGQGYFSATTVPNFGNATLSAVRAFQKAHGISQTGTVGPLTRAAIQAACSGTSSSGSGAVVSGSTAVNTTTNSFEISGWLPYWRGATSTADVIPHLSELTEVNPFVYSVESDGSIKDNAGMNAPPWSTLVAAAEAAHVRVIPTVMWSDTSAEHAILSNTTKRIALETAIANLAKVNNYDGIEIDFEGKSAADKNYFSTFLKGLYERMGQRWVMCDIEARTPVDARYYGSEIPPDAEVYANDFTQINKYCDRVKLMTYDQQGVDQQLAAAAASSSQLYAPVADPLWVEKVIQLAERSIKPSKLMIGVPTYGYEYDVTAYAGNEYNYDILWTFDPGYATQLEQQYGVSPMRNSAGEMQFTYFSSTPANPLPTMSNISSALLAAAAATAYADSNNAHQDFRLVDWPDAQSIAGKAELAQNLGVRGISIFKLDGGEDPMMWEDLVGVKH